MTTDFSCFLYSNLGLQLFCVFTVYKRLRWSWGFDEIISLLYIEGSESEGQIAKLINLNLNW